MILFFKKNCSQIIITCYIHVALQTDLTFVLEIFIFSTVLLRHFGFSYLLKYTNAFCTLLIQLITFSTSLPILFRNNCRDIVNFKQQGVCRSKFWRWLNYTVFTRTTKLLILLYTFHSIRHKIYWGRWICISKISLANLIVFLNSQISSDH